MFGKFPGLIELREDNLSSLIIMLPINHNQQQMLQNLTEYNCMFNDKILKNYIYRNLEFLYHFSLIHGSLEKT